MDILLAVAVCTCRALLHVFGKHASQGAKPGVLLPDQLVSCSLPGLILSCTVLMSLLATLFQPVTQ